MDLNSKIANIENSNHIIAVIHFDDGSSIGIHNNFNVNERPFDLNLLIDLLNRNHNEFIKLESGNITNIINTNKIVRITVS